MVTEEYFYVKCNRTGEMEMCEKLLRDGTWKTNSANRS